ncbi:hypothetical protein FQN60_009731 [Etheostoma spectabile]|uniref:Uncharacterized protein n=1 Tax=Etheostoma spectabile TaxID=54343 RepID=A0A5J5DJQ8_9PERO|nr:hypothetical protein FQN60_009731 [Etheostoma spectabile]
MSALGQDREGLLVEQQRHLLGAEIPFLEDKELQLPRRAAELLAVSVKVVSPTWEYSYKPVYLRRTNMLARLTYEALHDLQNGGFWSLEAAEVIRHVFGKACDEGAAGKASEVPPAHCVRSVLRGCYRLQGESEPRPRGYSHKSDVIQHEHDFIDGVSTNYGVTEPRKQAYADFYKQYDAVKEFTAMKEAGVFESVRPSGE